MVRLCHFISCLLLTLLFFAPLSSARAEQAFQRFLPLLVELNGWQGDKPDGVTAEMPGTRVTTANREYSRGSAKAHASVVMGPAAAGALAPIQSGMNIQSSEGHMVTATVGGMQVMKSFNTSQKSGALLVALGKEAMFSFAYDGISEDEALVLAQKFDWKAMQAAAQAK